MNSTGLIVSEERLKLIEDVVLARSRQRETGKRRDSDSQDGEELREVACLVKPDIRRREGPRETDISFEQRFAGNELQKTTQDGDDTLRLLRAS